MVSVAILDFNAEDDSGKNGKDEDGSSPRKPFCVTGGNPQKSS